jgi:DNA topoisomerase-3
MILYIAEKPSMGRAIAAALPKPHKNEQGFIRVGNGDCVTWCIGHLVEQAEPDSYDARYKKWQMNDLPIIPEHWQLQPKPKTRQQISVIRKLIKEASQLVHAGDPDREGQLLVDEIINFVKTPKTKRAQALRLIINDLNTSAVKKALGQLKNNSEFIPLSTSALARSRADWLYGINLTRAYTLKGRQSGYNSVLSVGRVQTPLLGLVVRRDQEIEHFQSKPFYQVKAHLKIYPENTAIDLQATWQPSDACQPYMDEEGRVLSKALAENVVKRITGQPAEVLSYSKQTKKQYQPLPYNLSSLQMDASKRFNYSAQSTLDACQTLYEKHQLITYPRSDNRYLPEEQFSEAPDVITAIKSNQHLLANLTESVFTQINPSQKTKAWNTKKVEAHHAIIPTAKTTSSKALSAIEKNVYELICRQFLMQFLAASEFLEAKAEFDIQGGRFAAKSKQRTIEGWQLASIFNQNKSAASSSTNDDESRTLPELQKGQILYCETGELLEKQTQPPQHFTDASLLSAMTGINRYVKDPEIKKILKDTDGLGTEATRASIIELLFKRKFLVRQGKKILATDTAKEFINTLPESTTLPDMTAQWEATLDAICQKQSSYQGFMQPLQQQLEDMISQANTIQFTGLTPIQKPAYKRRKKSKKSVRKASKQ